MHGGPPFFVPAEQVHGRAVSDAAARSVSAKGWLTLT